MQPQLPGISQIQNLPQTLGHQNLAPTQQSLQLALSQHQHLLSNPQQLLGNPQHLLNNQIRPQQIPALPQPQIPTNGHQPIKEELKSNHHHG